MSDFDENNFRPDLPELPAEYLKVTNWGLYIPPDTLIVGDKDDDEEDEDE